MEEDREETGQPYHPNLGVIAILIVLLIVVMGGILWVVAAEQLFAPIGSTGPTYYTTTSFASPTTLPSATITPSLSSLGVTITLPQVVVIRRPYDPPEIPSLQLIDLSGTVTTLDLFDADWVYQRVALAHQNVWYITHDTLKKYTPATGELTNILKLSDYVETDETVYTLFLDPNEQNVYFLVGAASGYDSSSKLIRLSLNRPRREVILPTIDARFTEYASDFTWIADDLVSFSTGSGDAGCGFSATYLINLRTKQLHEVANFTKCDSDFDTSGSLVSFVNATLGVALGDNLITIAKDPSKASVSLNDYATIKDVGELIHFGEHGITKREAVDFTQFTVIHDPIELPAGYNYQPAEQYAAIRTAVKTIVYDESTFYVHVQKPSGSAYVSSTDEDGYYELTNLTWEKIDKARFDTAEKNYETAGLATGRFYIQSTDEFVEHIFNENSSSIVRKHRETDATQTLFHESYLDLVGVIQ